MVMAMVLKEKPLQEVKYTTNMVSPDFENFQQLLREVIMTYLFWLQLYDPLTTIKAEDMGGTSRTPAFICTDTADIDEIQGYVNKNIGV